MIHIISELLFFSFFFIFWFRPLQDQFTQEYFPVVLQDCQADSVEMLAVTKLANTSVKLSNLFSLLSGQIFVSQVVRKKRRILYKQFGFNGIFVGAISLFCKKQCCHILCAFCTNPAYRKMQQKLSHFFNQFKQAARAYNWHIIVTATLLCL